MSCAEAARRTRTRAALALLPLLIALAFPPPSPAAGSAGIAALQVGLHSRGLYDGTVDGLRGPATADAVRALQARAGLPVDGVAGPRTRRALGRFARHPLGSRPLHAGLVGWDVAALQFLLAQHGFPSAAFDGVFGGHLTRALRRFQRWRHLPADGIAGASTLAALAVPPPSAPLRLEWPLKSFRLGDPFGPRGNRFHTGIDLAAGAGTPVYSARSGRVVYAGWMNGGWGLLVVISHGAGEQSLYAHLSRVDVRPGRWVGTGARVGAVGATGDATGPHLHFEVRVRGAAVDPRPALP